jgi:transcriptional regulator with XRE-family HTH domain
MERSSPVKNPQVGRNLRKLRLARKLSIRKFCEMTAGRDRSAIAPTQLLATEKAKREPTLDMAIRYARVLGVTLDDLVAK